MKLHGQANEILLHVEYLADVQAVAFYLCLCPEEELTLFSIEDLPVAYHCS